MSIQASPSNQDGDDGLDSFPAEVRYEPDVKLGEQQLNGRVLKMLSELTLEQRAIVELKIFQSLTFEEIAELQELSANTAKTRFYSALKKLKVVSEKKHALS